MPYHHTIDFFQHSQFELNKRDLTCMQISGEKKDDPFKGFKEVPRVLGLKSLNAQGAWSVGV